MSAAFEVWWNDVSQHHFPVTVKDAMRTAWQAALGSAPPLTGSPDKPGWYWVCVPDSPRGWHLRHFSYAHGTHANKGIGYWADASGFSTGKKFVPATSIPEGTRFFGPLRSPE